MHSDGEQQRDFIYVDDLIDLAIKVQQGDGYDAVNVSTNITHSINELATITARIMGCENIRPQYIAANNYWKKYPDLYEGTYPISSQALEHEVLKYTRLSNDHAKKKYCWQSVIKLEEGIRRTVEFSVKVLEKARGHE